MNAKTKWSVIFPSQRKLVRDERKLFDAVAENVDCDTAF